MEGCDYEVFLSYRGPDTRLGFTDHLYTRLADAGVRTYRDDDDLRVGEVIVPDLLRAIEQSKIFIPIFSKGYASSRWSLDELACAVDCWKRKGHVIMPIFYHVEPSEVRTQTGYYGQALLAHEELKRVDDETIRKWRAALKEVAGLKGWTVENGANRYEGQLVKEVVTKVSSELKKACLVVSDFLVGVDDNVNEVLGMIGTDTYDAKIVGIHGMRGIGKTTLAKIVYNKLSEDFADSCFLADVRETSHRRGIEWLQTRLISDLSKQAHPNIINSMDVGIRTIEERFSRKKVLILLDDVDEKNQLTALLGRRSSFGRGSRILITTRKVSVLREFGVKLTYLVGRLDPERSLQLFSKHVFKRDHPPIEKMEKSKEIVNIAEGLPLILEVMGSTLSIYAQEEEMWDVYLVKWKTGHIEGIQSAEHRNSLENPSNSIIKAESSSEGEFSKPANTEHSSCKGVDRKYEGTFSREYGKKINYRVFDKKVEYVFSGNEGGIDYIRCNDDELMKLNRFPDGGTAWRKIGKISVSSIEIARGSNGTIVYEGKYEDRPAAVKRVVGAHHKVAYNETQKLSALENESIVRYFGKQSDDDFVYLALERCDCNLDDLIQVHSNSSNNSVYDDSASMDDNKIKRVKSMMEGYDLWRKDDYPSPCLLKLMRDVVSGLEFLHHYEIIHQDLKPQNVLIRKNRSLGAKLSDMGISTCLPKDRSSMGYHAIGCGTPGWQAPEQLNGGRQTQAMDLFSLGCVLFFCITRGRHPFGEILFRESNIAKNEMDLSSVEFIPEAHDLLSRLLNEDPNLRPKASEVLHHPFFWSSDTRLSFLGDVSDKVELEETPYCTKKKKKVELEARIPTSDLLKALESNAQLVFDGNWDDKIEREVWADLCKFRHYGGRSVGELLRAVRNKRSHYAEASKEVKEILGSVPDGLDAYFARRFPRLLMESYRVVSRICKEEECFQKYSLFPPWPLPTEIPSSSQQGRP